MRFIEGHFTILFCLFIKLSQMVLFNLEKLRKTETENSDQTS